jgi:predicted component of type VI protein secretion system
LIDPAASGSRKAKKKPASGGIDAVKARPASGSGGQGTQRALPPFVRDEASAAAAALTNTTGALQHLATACDEAKAQLAAGGGLAQLSALLRGCGAAVPGAWDGALGALWQASLLSGSEAPLAAAGAPAFLVKGPRGMRLRPETGG